MGDRKRVIIPLTIIRMLFGVVWLIDASFKWNSTFIHSFTQFFSDASQGQPAFLHAWYAFWIHLVSLSPQYFAYATATIETILGVSLLLGFGKRLGYVAGIIFSLLIWTTVEGFGGPYSASSTDIGTGIVYAFCYMLLLISSGAISDKFSLDYFFKTKFMWSDE